MVNAGFGHYTTQIPMVPQGFPQQNNCGSQPQARAHFTEAYNVQFMQLGSSGSAGSASFSQPHINNSGGSTIPQQWFFDSGAINHITKPIGNESRGPSIY